MRIAIGYMLGSSFDDVVMPIAVNAKDLGDGYYSVFGEEFRAYIKEERMSGANQGRGLLYSFYGDRIKPLNNQTHKES